MINPIPQQTSPEPLSFNPAAYPQRVPLDPYRQSNEALGQLADYVSRLPAQTALVGQTEAETAQMKAYTAYTYGSQPSSGTPSVGGIAPGARMPDAMQGPSGGHQMSPAGGYSPASAPGGGQPAAPNPFGQPSAPQGPSYDHYGAFQQFKAQSLGGGAPQGPSGGGVQWGGQPTQDDPAGIGASMSQLGALKYQVLAGALQAGAQRRATGQFVAGSPVLKSIAPAGITPEQAQNIDPNIIENAARIESARQFNLGRLGLESQKVKIQQQNADTTANRLTQAQVQNLTNERRGLVTTNAGLAKQLPPKVQGVIDSLGLGQIPGLGLSQAQQAAVTQYKQNQQRMQEIDTQLKSMPGQPQPPAAGAPAGGSDDDATAYLKKNYPNYPITPANVAWARGKVNAGQR